MATDNPYTAPRAAVADVNTAGAARKHQVVRVSLHQNGKVFGVLSALLSLVILVPVLLFMLAAGENKMGFGALGMLLLPLVYFVMSYIMAVIGGLIYNQVVKFTGGLEYESAVQPD